MVVKFYVLHLTQCQLLTPHFFRLSMCAYLFFSLSLKLCPSPKNKIQNQQENSRMFHQTWSFKKIIKDVQVLRYRLVCQYWTSQTRRKPAGSLLRQVYRMLSSFLQIKQISGISRPKLTLQLNSNADLVFFKEGTRQISGRFMAGLRLLNHWRTTGYVQALLL